MMASASRSSGLDIPFVEMPPQPRELPSHQHSDPHASEFAPGTLIAERYRVLRKIGEGGMGLLYACMDTVLSREVAVKLMRRSLAVEPLIAERLMREAMLAAQLRRHVAQVFDCGMLETGEPYIVMELLNGRDMYAVMRESGPVTPAELSVVMLQVCDGLAEAHAKGIIHRDLKPENLFCATEPDGRVVIKIVDFGVSKQVSGRRMRAQTNPGESVGSPQYMSPEQITAPSEVDARTDIWSLGVVMYELLTGALPFRGAGTAQICAAVLTEAVPPISEYRNDVPPALEFIIRRCLEKDRARRFDGVSQLSAALAALDSVDARGSRFQSVPPTVTREGLTDDSLMTVQRPRRRWVGVLCGLAVLGGCAAVLGQGVRQGRIHVPSKSEIREIPSRIAAWRFSLPLRAPDSDQ
ncbi:MAG TPA: serine/threonine-protein kinase [Polyangiaceae bacterium]|nr:serine/threonine-protein kinase [Polyangiaceae bacterium]